MIYPLVTAAQAKTHLRVDHNLDDAYIAECVLRASAVVLNYIKQFPRGEYDTLPVYDGTNPPVMVAPWPWAWPVSSQPPYWWPATKVAYRELPPYVVPDWFGSPSDGVPHDIQAATLLVIGSMFKDREGQANPISPAVESLLERWRDPSMA